MSDEKKIRAWMIRHAEEHTDKRTNELNCTSLVEAWDREESTGSATIDDPHHIAWDIAVEIADRG